MIGVHVHGLDLGTQAAPRLQLSEHDELADPDRRRRRLSATRTDASCTACLSQRTLVVTEVGRVLPVA